jgi:hypothetical protein
MVSKKITEGKKSKKLNLGQSLVIFIGEGGQRNFFGRRFLKIILLGLARMTREILRNITVGREILLTNVGTFGTWCQ